MTPEEIAQWENEIFTKLVIDELKRQKANGQTDFLLNRFEIEQQTKERLKKLLVGNRL